MKETFKIHDDAGHGWLEVPAFWIIVLEIAHKVTPFSYIDLNKKKVYLEEDCDLSLFVENLPKGVSIDFNKLPRIYKQESPIRNLPSYSPERLANSFKIKTK